MQKEKTDFAKQHQSRRIHGGEQQRKQRAGHGDAAHKARKRGRFKR